MYFRQVLGRIIRRRISDFTHEAYLYLPVQTDHLIYARRLLQETPEGYIRSELFDEELTIDGESLIVPDKNLPTQDDVPIIDLKKEAKLDCLTADANADNILLEYFLNSLHFTGDFSVSNCTIDGLN